jgi:hypothetical protein
VDAAQPGSSLPLLVSALSEQGDNVWACRRQVVCNPLGYNPSISAFSFSYLGYDQDIRHDRIQVPITSHSRHGATGQLERL